MENINTPVGSIKTWAEDERPREKMMMSGAHSLSKVELLAILINHGTRSKSAIDLARSLLKLANDSLHQLARLSIFDMQKVDGIGPAKAITIKAALELGLRKEADRLAFRKTHIKSPSDAVSFLKPILQDLSHECFLVIFLNNGNRVIDTQVISEGGISGTVVDVRMLARKALELGAVNIIAAHNHPSGNLNPSHQDKILTEKLKKALATIDISLEDHLILSDEGYYSFSHEQSFRT